MENDGRTANVTRQGEPLTLCHLAFSMVTKLRL